MEDCLFCKIIKREIPSNIVHEDDQVVVFPDIHPSADVHLLIVPKEHINSMGDVVGRGNLLDHVFQTINQLVGKNHLQDNLYRVVVNGGKAQHVPHLHFHLLGGKWKKMV